MQWLGTNYIDLDQLHWVDRSSPWEEFWQAMEQLIREGKVLYVGSSNLAGWQIARANAIAKDRHLLGLVAEQCYYTLIHRRAEMEIIPACASGPSLSYAAGWYQDYLEHPSPSPNP